MTWARLRLVIACVRSGPKLCKATHICGPRVRSNPSVLFALGAHECGSLIKTVRSSLRCDSAGQTGLPLLQHDPYAAQSQGRCYGSCVRKTLSAAQAGIPMFFCQPACVKPRPLHTVCSTWLSQTRIDGAIAASGLRGCGLYLAWASPAWDT